MAAASLELDSPEISALLDRLTREDVVGQLIERRGRMAHLATEAGDVKLDWVDQVAWALDHPDAIDGVETLAESIRSRFAHVVWSGMGGSIQAVHTLKGLGLLETNPPSVHPLDSTDPAALNRLLRELGSDGDLPAALGRTLMVGVSMGMTSEEPITHLRWFEGLLRAHGVDDTAQHMMVMTLPGSFLDQFAQEKGAPRVDIQLDGESHTPGRMSAPSTRVFLLPAALGLPGRLHEIMRRLNEETTLQPGIVEDTRSSGWRRGFRTRWTMDETCWCSTCLGDGRRSRHGWSRSSKRASARMVAGCLSSTTRTCARPRPGRTVSASCR